MPDTQKQTEKSQKKLSLAIIINGKTETTNDSYEIERKARKNATYMVVFTRKFGNYVEFSFSRIFSFLCSSLVQYTLVA